MTTVYHFTQTCSNHASPHLRQGVRLIIALFVACFSGWMGMASVHAQAQVPVRLNAGFPYTPVDIFGADDHFDPADSKEYGNGAITLPGGIANPQVDEEVYTSSRVSFLFGGDFGYDIPLACGKYDVILHFAEIYYGAPGGVACGDCSGLRVFDIDIEEGLDGVSNFDIVAAAGGSVAATSLTFSSLNITDGNLDIDFSAVVESPSISAIEIIPVAGPTAARVRVDGGCSLTSNTFADGSFQITNSSPGGQQITQVSFNLSTAILPNLVFDPAGTAGDALGKDLTPNSGILNVVPGAHSFSSPLGTGGFQEVSIPFSDFGGSETFTFSVDIDPISIEGLLTAETSQAAVVAGSELMGATITITFDDGSSETGQLYPLTACNGASEVVITSCNDIPDPVVESTVQGNPTLVYNPSQYYLVNGTPGDQACVWVAESGFYDGTIVPNGFEANDITSVAQYCGTIGADGNVNIPFTLFDDDGDINRVSSVVKRSSFRSDLSKFQILQSGSLPATPGSSTFINVGAMASLGDVPLTFDGITFELDDDSYWTNGDLGHAAYLVGPDPISNTTADEIYLKDRHGFDMSFTYPGLTPGTYSIQLYFAETFHGVFGGNPSGTVGTRIMDITIEGQKVLADLDLFDLYGPTTASIRTFSSVTVGADGILNIDFTKPSGPDVPAVQAIGIIAIDNPVVFPVELIRFDAIPQAHDVLLKWATASEVNNHFFTIERSRDSRIFEAVDNVAGQGNSRELVEYAFTDEQPYQGVSYYRLKQTDLDGAFTYSNVVAVNFSPGLATLNVYPNPSDGNTLYVNLEGYRAKHTVELVVSDLMGRVVHAQRAETGHGGNQLVRINLRQPLQRGLYQVQVVDEREQWSKRLLVK